MAFSIFFFNSSSFAVSSFFNASFASLISTIFFLPSILSTGFTCPCFFVTSLPPPLITDSLAPTALPLLNATLSGVLKYCSIPSNCAFEVDPSNHMSRKKAIIAVTKSA